MAAMQQAQGNEQVQILQGFFQNLRGIARFGRTRQKFVDKRELFVFAGQQFAFQVYFLGHTVNIGIEVPGFVRTIHHGDDLLFCQRVFDGHQLRRWLWLARAPEARGLR